MKKLAVPHFQQQHPYTCIPACARMVLAYWGHTHGEEELAQAFDTLPFLGTLPEKAVDGLKKLGYHALWFENATIERLLNLLAHEWPVVVFLRAADLPHGRAGLHAVVLVDIEEKSVICQDPSLKTSDFRLSVSIFWRAWSALDHQGLVIWA